jgi:hypothetical protein
MIVLAGLTRLGACLLAWLGAVSARALDRKEPWPIISCCKHDQKRRAMPMGFMRAMAIGFSDSLT